MAKVWKDSDEVIKMVHELPSNKLRHLDKEMTETPKKWDKKYNMEVYHGYKK